jgi:hypothetical protein
MEQFGCRRRLRPLLTCLGQAVVPNALKYDAILIESGSQDGLSSRKMPATITYGEYSQEPCVCQVVPRARRRRDLSFSIDHVDIALLSLVSE